MTRRNSCPAVTAALLLGGGCAVTPDNVCGRGEVEILARTRWYRGMETIPVQTFTGTLGLGQAAPAPEGVRFYAFTLDGVNVFVTEPRLIARMRNWVGRKVVIRGKTTNVGFGQEIWPGSISCADREAQE